MLGRSMGRDLTNSHLVNRVGFHPATHHCVADWLLSDLKGMVKNPSRYLAWRLDSLTVTVTNCKGIIQTVNSIQHWWLLTTATQDISFLYCFSQSAFSSIYWKFPRKSRIVATKPRPMAKQPWKPLERHATWALLFCWKHNELRKKLYLVYSDFACGLTYVSHRASKGYLNTLYNWPLQEF